MHRCRVIPSLLIDENGRLVKTIQFNKRTYIGDPINAVKIFNEKAVDELVLLDIDATKKQAQPNYELIEEVVSEAFMPVAYGGGVKNMEQMSRIFRLGVEKVIICSAALENLKLISEGAERYGSQSIVACLDVDKGMLGGYKVTSHSGDKKHPGAPVEWAKKMEQAGVGELIIYAVHRDGTFKGYDIPLLQSITSAVGIPVVACGGAGRREDFVEATKAGCTAVAAGSMFVYQGPQRGVLISYLDSPIFLN